MVINKLVAENATDIFGAENAHVANIALTLKDRQRRYSKVVAAILQHRPEHGTPIAQFAYKNFMNLKAISTQYPELRFLKAAEVRGMLPCVLDLCIEFDDGSEYWKHQIKMFRNLCTVYHVIHTGSIILSDDEFQVMKKAAKVFLNQYTYLSRLALDDAKMVYNVVPKFHYFYHLVMHARWTNPRFAWCYGGEDLVGKISTLGMSCTRGTAVYNVPEKLMSKYRLAVHVEWTR